jgi:hypothetical protein
MIGCRLVVGQTEQHYDQTLGRILGRLVVKTSAIETRTSRVTKVYPRHPSLSAVADGSRLNEVEACVGLCLVGTNRSFLLIVAIDKPRRRRGFLLA